MLRIRSITGHLFLFALALTLPILVMSALIGWGYIRQEERRIDSLAESRVATVASEIENRLDTFRATLNVLSVGPSVVAGNVEDVRRRLDQIDMPAGVWFVLRDPSGQYPKATAVDIGPVDVAPNDSDHSVMEYTLV